MYVRKTLFDFKLKKRITSHEWMSLSPENRMKYKRETFIDRGTMKKIRAEYRKNTDVRSHF